MANAFFMDKQAIHIGKLIEMTMKEQGRANKWLAECICVCPPAITKLYKKKSIDTDRLMLISQALNVDFFQYYSDIIDIQKFPKWK